MADPVTMAVVGATAGAAMSPKDPLKGALLGAAGGYGGGAALGAMGSAAAPTMVAAPTVAGGATTGGIFSMAPAGMTAAAPTAMQSIGSSIAGGAGGLGKWMGQNPYLANMAVGTGMNALTPPPSPPSGGLIAGRPQEIDMMGGMPTQPFMQQRKLSLL